MIPKLMSPDRDALSAFFDLDDPQDLDLLRELLESVLAEGPANLALLFSAMSANELGEVEKAAHGLKSALGNVGLAAASELCNRIMEAARSGDLEASRPLVASLQEAAECLEQEILAFLASL